MTPPLNAAFVRNDDHAWQEVAPGMRRKVLGHGPDLMMVQVQFEQGAVGAIHHHPHRQVTWVASGRFEVRVGEATRVLAAGDCFFAQADVPHGVVALEPGTLLDVFTPARQDFLPAT